MYTWAIKKSKSTKMKLLFLYMSLLLLISMRTADGFYDISFQSLDGSVIRTSSYEGKKVVIGVVSGSAAGVKLAKYLDSVQKANPAMQAIAIPTGEFDGSIKAQDLRELKKDISIIIAQPLKVRKANGTQQHPLFAWLTHSSGNKHFNIDVTGEGQLFFISAKGTLYAVLPSNTPYKAISKVMNQSFTN
jgi:glutathione peroxidase-family protein